jgi:hypothetical protein
MAFADQVLELPQNAASSVSSPASTVPADEPIHPHKHHHHASESAAEASTAASAPLPANLGTLEDYERDNDEDPSAGAASNFASGPSYPAYSANPANPVFELSGNSHQTLAQNAILGVLMIGLFAMEVQAAHHHHH